MYIQTLKASEKLLDERIARLFVKFKNYLWQNFSMVNYDILMGKAWILSQGYENKLMLNMTFSFGFMTYPLAPPSPHTMRTKGGINRKTEMLCVLLRPIFVISSQGFIQAWTIWLGAGGKACQLSPRISVSGRRGRVSALNARPPLLPSATLRERQESGTEKHTRHF